jgi:CHAT domain-containing protein
MKKLLIFLLFFFSFPSNVIRAQCPDPVTTMESVFTIEGSDASEDEKIMTLSALQDRYRKCNKPRDSVYARIMHRLGDLYRLNHDFEKGIQYTMQAVRINKSRGSSVSSSFLTNSYYNLGLYYALLSDFERSNDYFDSCILNGIRFQHKIHIALMAYEQKSFNYFTAGDYQKSIDASSHGIYVAQKHGNKGYEGVLLQQKAQSQLALGNDTEAEKNGKAAVALLENDGDMRAEYLAAAYATYARILVVRKKPNAAVQWYRKSIAVNTRMGNYSQCSRDFMDLGFVYDRELRDTTKAMECYRKGITVLEKAPDPYQLAAVHNNIGVAHWRNGSFTKALKSYQTGLTSLPLNFSSHSISENPSWVQLKAASNDHFLAMLLQNKGDALLAQYKKTQDGLHLRNALNAFRCADKVVDQMRARQARENSKLFWREKTRKLYSSAIETCYLLGDVHHAFFFFEKSRAVLLNDKLNELGAKQSLSQKDVEAERTLRAELLVLQQSIETTPQESPGRRELEAKWYGAQDKFEKYIRHLEKNYPLYFQYKYDTSSYSVKDVQEFLAAADQTLILYFTTDMDVYSFTLSATEASVQKVTFTNVRDVVDRYIELCSTPTMSKERYSELAATSSFLCDKLFKPLPVKTKKVAISFDEYFIPFESLLKSKDDLRSFLLNDHVFHYVYSAAYLLKRNESASVSNSLLGVAPVSYDANLNLSPLRGAANSLKKIQSYFNESVSLTNETATKETFMEKFPHYPVVHVYSHAMADYAGTEPMLYFRDEPVLLTELQALPEVKTQLIVLSGCRTGVGKTVKGEGVFSLARGFAAAGIPSTITTLWSVDDKVTYDIMEKFYAHLQNGVPSDEALQKAKLEFLENQDGQEALPYYWASTVVLGKSMTLEKTSFVAGHMLHLCIGLTCILSAATFFLRKRIRLL